MRFPILIMILFLFTACGGSGQNCGDKVLVLWPDRTGTFVFQTVRLESLNSPYELSSGVAKVFFENALGSGGYQGGAARPNFTQSGDVCVPMDADSSMAVATFARFEDIHKFETKLGFANLMRWPRAVGLDVRLRLQAGQTPYNNAHYLSSADVTAVLPYNQYGLPLGLNPGIVAHEHFHAHFQRQVLNVMNAWIDGAPRSFDDLFYPSFSRPAEDMDPKGDFGARELNAFVLRGWNEGLADLYGAIYSGDPEFFRESLPGLVSARSLVSPSRMLATRADFERFAGRPERAGKLVEKSYEQGTLLARALYEIAHSGIETPEAFLARVMRRLSQLPERIFISYDIRVLDGEAILPILLEGMTLNRRACDTLARAMQKDTLRREFPVCGF